MPEYQVWYGERTPIVFLAKNIDELRCIILRNRKLMKMAKDDGGFAVSVNYKHIGFFLIGKWSGYSDNIPRWRPAGSKRIYMIYPDGRIIR